MLFLLLLNLQNKNTHFINHHFCLSPLFSSVLEIQILQWKVNWTHTFLKIDCSNVLSKELPYAWINYLCTWFPWFKGTLFENRQDDGAAVWQIGNLRWMCLFSTSKLHKKQKCVAKTVKYIWSGIHIKRRPMAHYEQKIHSLSSLYID